jgi:LPPG:FO 2-phospho-L-lactate transferase
MKITALSGGVGGARMLRGLAAIEEIDLTAVVNVGDDETIYGLHLSPDLDTVIYTMAEVHSDDRGWGRTDETWNVMDELARFPIDTTFRLGDKDLALNMYRTARLVQGATLTEVTAEVSKVFGLTATILPATDDPMRTKVLVESMWLDFQDYFVRRRHVEVVRDIRFAGADETRPAPGVMEALAQSDAVVIGPSNPILSIWPILAVPGVADAIRSVGKVIAVSPLIGGAAVKGPIGELLPSFGYTSDTNGIVASYKSLLTDIVVHHGDEPRSAVGPRVHVTDTIIKEADAATRLSAEVISWLR